MTKEKIKQEVLKFLEKKIQEYEKLLEDLRERIIESESRNTSRYDTTRQELSYLFDAYAKKLHQIKEEWFFIKENFKLKDNYILGKNLGGEKIKINEKTYYIITKKAPIYKKIFGE